MKLDYNLILAKLFTYLEHSLVERSKKCLCSIHQIDIALVVVGLELCEVLLEHVGVLLVDDAVRPGEHVVELTLGLGQQQVDEI